VKKLPAGKLAGVSERKVKNMLIQRVNRSDAEKTFISVRNVGAASLGRGYGANMVHTSTNGVDVVAAGAGATGFVGIATQDIAVNDYGLVQTSGWVASVRISNVGSSITINPNDPLVPAAAGFFSAAPTYVNSGNRWVFASNLPASRVVSAASYVSGLIRMF
jgi:hypothetical protein